MHPHEHEHRAGSGHSSHEGGGPGDHGHHHHDHGPGGHSHVPTNIRTERPLWWALGLTSVVLLFEVAGALFSGSLALLSDAAHMATDTLALAIALVAVRLARRPPDARRTYGYARFEALGALANGTLLVVLSAYILFEAASRLLAPREVISQAMLVVALVGLACNLVSMKLLHAASGENLNLRGAYLEVWSDMLGSAAVVVAAVVIALTGWRWVDPVLAALIGLWVLPRTWILLREALNVLMEGVPSGLDVAALRADLLATSGVAGVHDLHVWALASRTPAMTAHVVAAPGVDPGLLREHLARMLGDRYHIGHLTLQLEQENAACAAPACDLPPAV
jgi:cobalt-zinc-cadmium efflux system protein